ncbi:NUDIX pyrophosphatase [Priestia sp. FSL H7-0729]
MSRAPFQILVFPYTRSDDSNDYVYAIFRRAKEGYWQGIAGGGEDEEKPLEAAMREANEEAGISLNSRYMSLKSSSTHSVVDVIGYFMWGPDTFVIPEYCFGVELDVKDISLSDEHTEYKWVTYEEAREMLKWDSNRVAIWELNQRLIGDSSK